jgi:hypothetical protein
LRKTSEHEERTDMPVSAAANFNSPLIPPERHLAEDRAQSPDAQPDLLPVDEMLCSTTPGEEKHEAHRGIIASMKKGVTNVIDACDRWTSPQESTRGDFVKPSYFQSCFSAASMGYVFGGLKGSVASVAASTVGIFVASKTKSTALGMGAGATTRALVGGLMGIMGGPAGVFTGVMTGALVGAFQVLRGNNEANVRDTAGNTNLISGLFIPGPSKVSAGLGSAIALKMSASKTTQALIGAGIAMAIGAGLCALGISPVGMGTALLANGLAGALGPFAGPRFSQFFRNLGNAMGGWVSKGAEKLHLIDRPLTDTQKNVAGALPSSFLKEGLRSFILSDGSLVAVAIAGINESIKQLDVALHSGKTIPKHKS